MNDRATSKATSPASGGKLRQDEANPAMFPKPSGQMQEPDGNHGVYNPSGAGDQAPGAGRPQIGHSSQPSHR